MRRPPVRLVLVLAAVLLGVAVLGLGLLRAATYEEPAATPLAAGEQQLVPAAGTVGRCGDVPVRATRELRGMWLTTVLNIDFPSRPGLSEAQVKAEYLRWLDLAVARKHNAIFVHVRPSGDAFWPSAYAPWSEWLTGKRDGRSPGWDPMAFMVDEAHQRNLEFHAWFNPYRGTQPAPGGPGADVAKLAPDHPLRKHRDWAISYPDGRTARLYFDPGNPAARRFVEDAMLEAVQKYDVDGVHFDDFFYPYPEGGGSVFHDEKSYAKRTDKGQSLAAWRRQNVDTLVHEMSVRIKQLKPWVKFGISPFGIWRNKSTDPAGSDTNGLQSYDAQYADTRKWVRSGWLDYVVPQIYWEIGFGKADYAKVLPWWAQTVKGTQVQLYVGQADYRVGEKGAWKQPDQLDRQMALNDKYGVLGSVHYNSQAVRADKLGSVTRYTRDHYAGPALLPVMTRLPATPPGAPRISAARRTGTGVAVEWSPGAGPEPVSWALYRVNGTTADLVATGRRGAQDVADPAPPAGAATYCLSGLDRSGNEGPLSSPVPAPPAA
ncbi:glycoside hydrolase family 10 protein [Actinoplanes sp. N902-109]|uniref:glycoside hydrolase family 10 protein n=1 Tax=Actinoplanes sp. (strain N902-109) TaxID=649831 RepID=UPI000329559D|nr:family 10 glycosylhydrolase [Actinoplanes sp. N902-109]AGL17546.1 fenI protein [Actinoplanes sp. N902-109]